MWNRIATFGMLLALLLPSLLVADDDPKRDAEAKWARGIADDFLRVLKAQDGANIESLIAPDYAKLLHERNRYGEPASGVLIEVAKSFEKSAIAVESMSPDGDEAKYQGTLETDKASRAFVLRIVKQKDSGRWRVAFFVVDEEKLKEGKAKGP